MRACLLINQPRGIIHTEKNSNQVVQMFWSLRVISTCLEMCLQFLELAPDLSLAGSLVRIAEASSPNPVYSYSSRSWQSQLSLVERSGNQILSDWRDRAGNEEVEYAISFRRVLITFLFFTSHVACMATGDMLKTTHLTHVYETEQICFHLSSLCAWEKSNFQFGVSYTKKRWHRI